MIQFGSDTVIGMNQNNSDLLEMNSYPILSPGKLYNKNKTLRKVSLLVNFFNYKKRLYLEHDAGDVEIYN